MNFPYDIIPGHQTSMDHIWKTFTSQSFCFETTTMAAESEEAQIVQCIQGAKSVNPDVEIEDLLELAKNNKKLEAIFKNSKELKLLVSGKTGVGKSTLINGLIGEEVAVTSFGLSTTGVTPSVEPYCKRINGINVTIFDSPGLEDGSGKEEAYLDELYEKCQDVDLVIFALRYSDNRFVPGNPDALTMIKLTDKFGVSVWNKAIVVITCCNQVEVQNPQLMGKLASEKKAFFEKLLADYKNIIHSTLIKDAQVPDLVVLDVKVVPAGHEFDAYLLDGTLWFSNFWMECLTAIPTREARVSMLKLNARRLKSDKKITSDDLMRPLMKQPIFISEARSVATVAIPAAIGAGIGAIGLIAGPIGLIGIPLGIFVGMTIGAILTVKFEK